MDTYKHALELRLRRDAVRRHRVQRSVAAARILAPACAVVVAGVVLLNPGGRSGTASALPVLAGPRLPTSALPHELRQPLGAGTVPGEARGFETPYGQGFVILSADRKTICVAVPDKVEGFGSTCTEMAKAEREGVVVRLLSEAGSGPSELVVVLPRDGTAPQVTDQDGVRTMDVSNGVASGLFSKDATVSYQSSSGEHRLQMEAFAPEGQWYVGCGPHHSAVAVPGREGARHPKKYCDAANGR